MRLVFIFFILLSCGCNGNKNNNTGPDRDHKENLCPYDVEPFIPFMNCLEEKIKEGYLQQIPKQDSSGFNSVQIIGDVEMHCGTHLVNIPPPAPGQKKVIYSSEEVEQNKLSPEEETACKNELIKRGVNESFVNFK